ncbi:hypothetical protein [Phenylobacterium sp.]|jgi:hypothetical protein|uniref:hypothetical protein n=1 Tax=Phenylobacterium sp. TaxID=1871053 RepID=UPI002F91E54A
MSRAPTRASIAERFRREIEVALAEGTSPDQLKLRLTLGDLNRLRRDPSVSVADIGFAEGVMRFLGVEVQQGGISESDLQRVGPGEA